MTLSMNQFAIIPVPGDITLPGTGIVRTAQVSNSENGTIIPGQAVKIENSAGGIPKVLALTNALDIPYGVVVRDLKDSGYTKNKPFQIALTGTYVYMTAGGAIGRNQPVTFDYTTNKVTQLTGRYPQLGLADDKATADGDVIPVFITTPMVFVNEDALTA